MRGDAMAAINCATHLGPTPVNNTSTLYINFGIFTLSGVAVVFGASRCRRRRSGLYARIKGVAGIKPRTCKDGLKHGCRSAGKAPPVR
jgi:hypothetical protein